MSLFICLFIVIVNEILPAPATSTLASQLGLPPLWALPNRVLSRSLALEPPFRSALAWLAGVGMVPPLCPATSALSCTSAPQVISHARAQPSVGSRRARGSHWNSWVRLPYLPPLPSAGSPSALLLQTTLILHPFCSLFQEIGLCFGFLSGEQRLLSLCFSGQDRI